VSSQHDPASRPTAIRRAAARARRRTRTALDRVGSDATSEVRALLASGLFLPWYYALQTGREMRAEEAARHFLTEGSALGLLANPLHDFDATGLSPEQTRADLLDGSASTYPVRSLLDDIALVRAAPRSVEHRGGPVGFFLEQAAQGISLLPVQQRSWPEFETLRRRQSRALKVVAKSGLFERAYYESQVGHPFASKRAAMWHYAEVGEITSLSPHPLFERAWYRRRSKTKDPRTFAHLVRTGQTDGAAGPHFDAARYLADHPEAATHPGGALGHFGSTATPDTLTPADADVIPVPWGQVLGAVTTAARVYGEQATLTLRPPRRYADWYVDAGTDASDASQGDARQVCVVSDVRAWVDPDPAALASVVSQTHANWQLRVAVDDPDTLPQTLAEAMAEEPRISVVVTTAHTPAERANAVLRASEEDWFAFWSPRQTWSPDLLATLLTATPGPASSSTGDIVLGPDGRPYGPVRGDEGAMWRRPRSLAGMVLSRHALGDDPFRAEAGDVYQWDFLLRSKHEPAYVPFVAVRLTGEDVDPGPPGTLSTDEHVLRAERLLDWTALRENALGRAATRTSLLVPTYHDWRYTCQALETALSTTTADVEAVVVDNGSPRDVTSILAAVFAGEPGVHLHRLPMNTNFSTGSNVAFARSTGATVVFLNNDTEPRQGWLEPLVSALAEPGVLGAQPLLLYPDDSIQTAGTVFYGRGSIAGHLLASFPQEDLRPQLQLRFRAVTAACMALRADVVAAAEGFDPHYANGMEDVDLCLRLGEQRDGHFVTVRESLVVHYESKSPGRFAKSESNRLRFLREWGDRLPAVETAPWEEAGFEVTALRAAPGLRVSGRRTAVEPVLRRPPVTVTEGPGRGLPSLRWAIKIAAHGGPRGDGWGDVAFARDLAAALRLWGQEVVVDRRGAHQRPFSDYLDDVTLTLRGLDETFPQPGATNVLWVISHPEDVPADELSREFDLVYAAGRPWAQQMSLVSGREVRTLLQATNTDRFTPDGPQLDGLGTVFVGRTRNVFRPIVRDALEVGADLAIFGDGWTEYVDQAFVKAEHLPNDQLPAAYRGARVVLNDHWSDMARLGFFSNRLFDAAAAGARVVSDPVPGLEEVFGPSVQAYRTLEELGDLLHPESDRWADAAAIAENAVGIAAAHSFAQRARTLLADVLDVRGVPQKLR
jgi:GT2 family glycosyltransferase